MDRESKPSSKPKAKKLSLDNLPHHRDRGAEAIRRLGVDPDKIAGLPPINKLLKEQSKSGISGAIEAMRMSDGEISQQFLEVYDDIPERDRECLTLEIIAVAAKVDPRALLGEILLAAREYSVTKYKIRALEAHPEILEKRIEYAMLPGGYRDRDAMDTILGALPRSKTTFIDKFYAGSQTETDDTETTAPVTVAEEMVEDENFVFPDCESVQERLHPIRQKILDEKR